MHNNSYIYDTRTTKESFSVTDYTSYYYGGLTAVLNQYPDLFEYITINDDTKLEVISYKKYGSENYADVILACNEEVFLWSVPYSSDVLIEVQEARKRIFVSELGIKRDDARFEDFEFFIDTINDDVEQENTKKRSFRLPVKERLGDVINLISKYRRENAVTDLGEIEDPNEYL